MNEIEIGKLKTKLNAATRFSECLYYDHRGCDNRIIHGHSIAESKVMGRLSNSAYVYIPEINLSGENKMKPENFIEIMQKLAPDLGVPSVQIVKTPKKKASTSRTFCKYHDQILFQTIDQDEFEPSIEQFFLYAYRAFSKEYEANKKATMIFDKFHKRENFDVSAQKIKNQMLDSQKEQFDLAYKKSNFDILISISFELHYEINFAVSTVFNPTLDVAGKNLVDTFDVTKPVPPVFLNIFPERNETCIIFSCFKSDEQVYAEYFSQLRSLKKNKNSFRKYINYIVVAYPENIVFGENLYNFMQSANLWKAYENDYIEFSFMPMLDIEGMGNIREVQFHEYQSRKLSYNLLQRY